MAKVKAKAKTRDEATAVFHIEDVRPLIRQKGDLIKVSMTCRLSKEVWDDLGNLIGKTAEAHLIETDEPEEIDGQGELPLEGDD